MEGPAFAPLMGVGVPGGGAWGRGAGAGGSRGGAAGARAGEVGSGGRVVGAEAGLVECAVTRCVDGWVGDCRCLRVWVGRASHPWSVWSGAWGCGQQWWW